MIKVFQQSLEHRQNKNSSKSKTISMVYLLNKKYTPFNKWAFRGMENLKIIPDTRKMIKDLVFVPVQRDAWAREDDSMWKYTLNTNDKVVELIESICEIEVMEFNRQGLTNHYEPFLLDHTTSIISRIKDDKMKALHMMVG